MRVAHRNRIDFPAALLLLTGMLVSALALVALVSSSQHSSVELDQTQITSVSAKINGSIAFWEERAAVDPYDFVANNKLAQAYLRRAREKGDVADYTRAEAAVTASLDASRGDNFAATALLASIQSTKHEFAAAAETARSAIAMDPNDPYGYAVLGDAQLALGYYDEALANYEHIVAIAPGLTSFARLAHILEILNDVSGADLAWQNALSTNGGRLPENTAWAHAQYGDFQFRVGRVDAAEENYDRSLATLPGFAQALAGLANVRAANGDYDEAIGLYEAAIDRQPLPRYAATLGDLYAESGDDAAARTQYDLALAITGLYKANGIDTDLQTAIFFADHEINTGEAVRQAQAIYEVQPGSIYAADALGWALHRDGRTIDALPYVQRALRLDTPDPMLYFHSGVISLAAGEIDAARDFLTRATELNRNFSVLHARALASALTNLAIKQ